MSEALIWLPFVCGGAVGAALYAYRSFLVARYRPLQGDHSARVSVVSPVFREDPHILQLAVASWLAGPVDEVLLVIPAEDDASLQHARTSFGSESRVQILVSPVSAKRANLARGIRAAQNAIVVLADSDTLWEQDLVPNLIQPFADAQVAGVATRPRVLAAESSVWRRIADWLLDAKYLRQVPAMAAVGGVSCLSGRTVAYRRELVLDVLPELEHETFGGRRCVSGDDGRLTWLVLRSGHRTAYQRSAVVWTMAPETLRGFALQRLRFARNDYRNYLRALAQGWVQRQPLGTRLFVFQTLLAPVWSAAALVVAALAATAGELLAAGAWATAPLWGQGLINPGRMRRDPRSIVYLPLLATLMLAATGIRIYAACTLRTQGWMTRRPEAEVPEGQSAGSLGWSPPNDPTTAAAKGRVQI
jgi:N-acetylglucosaminyltransferase